MVPQQHTRVVERAGQLGFALAMGVCATVGLALGTGSVAIGAIVGVAVLLVFALEWS
ncbi:MAG: hypothetical protein JXA09_01875 [Anaerolineae bacterium]|nr:hypothetical protein [Anaerolineae bacterium]